jgi:hypothetical protein
MARNRGRRSGTRDQGPRVGDRGLEIGDPRSAAGDRGPEFDGPADVPRPRPTLAELALAARGGKGLECPDCGCRDLRVTNTWPGPAGTVRRLRKCRHCARPIDSVETVVAAAPKEPENGSIRKC